MADFGILNTQYRLIETSFESDFVVLKALEISTGRVVRIRTPNLQTIADPIFVERFHRQSTERARTGEGGAVFFPSGTFDERTYLVTDWETDVDLKSPGDLEATPPQVKDQAPKISPGLESTRAMQKETSTKGVTDLAQSPPAAVHAASSQIADWSALGATRGTVSRPADKRNSVNRSLSLLSAAILVAALAGGWYYWDVKTQREALGLLTDQAQFKRAAALKALAPEFEPKLFEFAEARLKQSREAAVSGATARASGLAREASEAYASSAENSWNKRLQMSIAKANAAFESVAGYADLIPDDYAAVLQLLDEARSLERAQSTEKAVEVFQQAIDGFTNLRLRADVLQAKSLLSEARERALAFVLDDADEGLAEADKAAAEGEKAVEQNALETALTHLGIARRKYDTIVRGASVATLQSLRKQVRDARLLALESGGASLPDFAAAEDELARGELNIQNERYIAAAQSLALAGWRFETVLEKQHALTAQALVETLKNSLRQETVDPQSAEVVAGQRAAALGAQFERESAFAEASRHYTEAAKHFEAAIDGSIRQRLGSLQATITKLKTEAETTGGADSAHYVEGVEHWRLAKTDISLQEKQAHLQTAASLFTAAVDELGARQAINDAARALLLAEEAGLTRDSEPFGEAFRVLEEARDSARNFEYASAQDLALRASILFRNAYEQQWREKISTVRHDLETLGAYLGEELNGAPRVIKDLDDRTELRMKEGDFAAAFSVYGEELAELTATARKFYEERLGEEFDGSLADVYRLDPNADPTSLRDALRKRTQSELLAGDDIAGAIALMREGLADLENAKSLVSRDRAKRAQQAAEVIREVAKDSGAGQLELFLIGMKDYEQGLRSLANEQWDRAYLAFNQAQVAFDRSALQRAADRAREHALHRRERLEQAAVPRELMEVQDARLSEAENDYQRGDYAAAARNYVAAATGFESAISALERENTLSTRKRAFELRDSVPIEGRGERFFQALSKLSGAGAALADGDHGLARQLYQYAIEDFEEANLLGEVAVAKAAVEEARAAVLEAGVRETDPDYQGAMGHIESGENHYSRMALSEALAEFKLGLDSLNTALNSADALSVLFIPGSSSAEIDSAMVLCEQRSSECVRQDFTSEQHTAVRLRPYVMDQYEVTNEEFDAFARSANYQTDAERVGFSFHEYDRGDAKAPGATWRSPKGPGSTYLRYPAHPVRHVSFQDASAYCAWKGGRLPTEAEWEYVARGPMRRVFPWGNRWEAHRLRWGGDPGGNPMPVGSFPESATPDGYHDLAGNVWEWTQSKAASGVVLKGGGWTTNNPANFRAAARVTSTEHTSHSDFGFRCVFDLDRWPDQ